MRWLRPLFFAVLVLPAPALSRTPLVVVDPGHGGARVGAVGPNSLQEKTLALKLAQQVRAALVAKGVRVSLTREKDEPLALSERVVLTNRERPDLFVSLHANSMPTRKLREQIEGIETFFLSASASHEEARKTAARENAEAPSPAGQKGGGTLALILADLERSEAHADSSRAAYAVHERLVAVTLAADRGVQQAPFYVLMGVEAPAILVEVGFISHPEEAARLAQSEYQRSLARALAEGVKTFLDEVARRDGLSGKAARP